MTALVRPIALDQLDRRADARVVDRDQVLAIATSMVDLGQISPIRVRPLEGGRFEIVAGVHRVEACRSLGLAEVDALVVDSGELFAELAMIDENLCRAELGPADRARQTARRKAIYEELHPETAHGAVGGGHDQSRQLGDSAPRFSADTAARTGASERSVQRDAARGERIRDEALGAVAGTDLDTGVFLDELKDLDPDQQLGHVRQRLNGERAIAARRVEPADSLDYFPTPPWATRALVEIVLPMLGHVSFDGLRVWEPACGEGHMSGVLVEYCDDVVATDIAGYGSAEGSPPAWIGRHDFLDPAYSGPTPPADWVFTNPPFADLSLAFALRALDLAQVGVALFVRQQWLEGVGRYGELFSKYPPVLVAQFAERVNLKKGEWDPEGDTLTAYCWVVWVKAPGVTLRNGDTRLMWIPPGQRDALTRPDDIERFTAHPVRVPNEDSTLAALRGVDTAGEGGSAAPSSPKETSPADLYDQAVVIVRETGKASASLIQRRLQLGYNKAMGLIERMEAAGVVTPPSSTGIRLVVISPPAAEPGDAGEVGQHASPALTSYDIDKLIIEGYAAGGPDLVQRLAAATGLGRQAVRKRASRLQITSADNQRQAARRAMTALRASRMAEASDAPN